MHFAPRSASRDTQLTAVHSTPNPPVCMDVIQSDRLIGQRNHSPSFCQSDPTRPRPAAGDTPPSPPTDTSHYAVLKVVEETGDEKARSLSTWTEDGHRDEWMERGVIRRWREKSEEEEAGGGGGEARDSGEEDEGGDSREEEAGGDGGGGEADGDGGGEEAGGDGGEKQAGKGNGGGEEAGGGEDKDRDEDQDRQGEEEEEDFDELTQDEDEEEVMSSASEESVLSVPELQVGTDDVIRTRRSWLMKECRYWNTHAHTPSSSWMKVLSKHLSNEHESGSR